MKHNLSLPTEQIELPSKGLVYPLDNPLSSGIVEMKYMTAKEEDILTNTNYIQRGIVIEKLLESLIVSDINIDDLVLGDKNAIIIAARILGYGKDYEVSYFGEKHTIDLSQLDNKKIDESLFQSRQNRFTFNLPTTNTVIEFKILTHKDEVEINKELEGLRKINKDNNSELITRLRYMILSVDGDSNKSTVNSFINNHFLARDSREFRKYINTFQPDVDLRFYPEGGPEGGVEIPIGVDFFWPDL